MSEFDDKKLDLDFKSQLYWMISIGVVSFFSYIFSFELSSFYLFSELLDFFVGAERWSAGSVYSNELELVWLYIYITYPFVVLKMSFKIDFSFSFTKSMPLFRENNFLRLVCIYLILFFMVYMLLKFFLFCELPFLGRLFESGVASGTFRNDLYGQSYIYPLVLAGMAAFSASIVLIALVVFVYHAILRVVRRKSF